MAQNDSLKELPLFSNLGDVSKIEAHTTAKSLDTNQSLSLYEYVKHFDAFGQPSIEFQDGSIPYLVNEFWTSAQRQCHSIHEISYRACFKPQLPEFFIRLLTRPGDWVYDPFMGRGTTPIQASLLRRKAAGNDVNPLSLLLTRPRLRPVSLNQVSDILRSVAWGGGQIENPDLLTFYSNQTLQHICALKKWLTENAPIGKIADPVIDWVRMVALNRLTGHSPGFFSVYTLPPNQAVSIQSQKRINEKRNQIPPDRDISKIIIKKTRSLLADGQPQPALDFNLSTAIASSTPVILNASIDLVVTSPPFLDIVQYADDNWLRCWFAGIEVNSVELAHHTTEFSWQEMIRDTLTELARIVRPGGYVAFEVGEVRKGRVLLERLVWDAAQGLPFERLFVMVNQQKFTKTANCWGVQNNAVGTNTNRIVLLRRNFR